MIGLTGPPGVGKSTLVSAFVRAWRERGRTVGVIAVDPSSRRTRGALLGDRTRIDVDPDDQGVFVRSMAARDRLGGLADLCAAAMVLMRALYDVVLIETVGVGQSETEIAEIADTVVFAVQPGSGDSLQFMKAGIVEIPDIALVTKADLGGDRRARQARPRRCARARCRRQAELAAAGPAGLGRRRGRGSTRRSTPSTAIAALDAAAHCADRRGGRQARLGSSAGCTRSSAGGAPPSGRARSCRASPPIGTVSPFRWLGRGRMCRAGAELSPGPTVAASGGGAGVSTASPASSGSSVGGQLLQPQQRQSQIAGARAHLAGILAAAGDRSARLRAGGRRRAPAAAAS